MTTADSQTDHESELKAGAESECQPVQKSSCKLTKQPRRQAQARASQPGLLHTDDDQIITDLINSLVHTLQQSPELNHAHQIVVGYSGGLDSTVLLKLLSLAQPKEKLLAVHINHALQSAADSWSKQCRQYANKLGIKFQGKKIETKPKANESVEAWARKSRYNLFEKVVKQNAPLVLAHHADDQVETLLLRLFRGSGVTGLSAMHEKSSHSGLNIYRPLLTLSRESLERIAEKLELSWIDDPSNEDTTFDRNYLRKKIVPIIKNRWESINKTINRTTENLQEASILLDELAAQDLQELQAVDQKDSLTMLSETQQISLRSLRNLSLARQKNVLRYWLRQYGFDLPSSARLKELLDVMHASSLDKSPKCDWKDYGFRRYRDRLCLLSSQQLQPFTQVQECLISDTNTIEKLHVEIDIEQLCLEANAKIVFAPRTQGVVFKRAGLAYSMSLKKLYQSYGVPSWLRDQIPLIYFNDELISVPWIGVTEKFLSSKHNCNQSHLIFKWRMPSIDELRMEKKNEL